MYVHVIILRKPYLITISISHEYLIKDTNKKHEKFNIYVPLLICNNISLIKAID